MKAKVQKVCWRVRQCSWSLFVMIVNVVIVKRSLKTKTNWSLIKDPLIRSSLSLTWTTHQWLYKRGIILSSSWVELWWKSNFFLFIKLLLQSLHWYSRQTKFHGNTWPSELRTHSLLILPAHLWVEVWWLTRSDLVTSQLSHLSQERAPPHALSSIPCSTTFPFNIILW